MRGDKKTLSKSIVENWRSSADEKSLQKIEKPTRRDVIAIINAIEIYVIQSLDEDRAVKIPHVGNIAYKDRVLENPKNPKNGRPTGKPKRIGRCTFSPLGDVFRLIHRIKQENGFPHRDAPQESIQYKGYERLRRIIRDEFNININRETLDALMENLSRQCAESIRNHGKFRLPGLLTVKCYERRMVNKETGEEKRSPRLKNHPHGGLRKLIAKKVKEADAA